MKACWLCLSVLCVSRRELSRATKELWVPVCLEIIEFVYTAIDFLLSERRFGK